MDSKRFRESALPFQSGIDREILQSRAEKIDKPFWGLCSGIDAFIDDEVKSTKEYGTLARSLSGHDMKTSILLESISLDENKHARMFRVLKALVC